VRPLLVVFAGFAVMASLLAWSRWLVDRRGAAAGHLLLAALLGLVVASGWPLAQYLDTFEVSAPDRPVAQVLFERIGPSRYRVTVTHLPAGRMQVVELAGDEWRFDLSKLDWAGGALRVGARPRYRVEAAISRPVPSAAREVPLGTTARLTGGNQRTPWLAGLGTNRGTPLLASRPLAGPWSPMAHGARFDVRVDASDGVVIEALNAAADDSLAGR
jgi:hypothetical protein